jgi:hypothetical protein
MKGNTRAGKGRSEKPTDPRVAGHFSGNQPVIVADASGCNRSF